MFFKENIFKSSFGGAGEILISILKIFLYKKCNNVYRSHNLLSLRLILYAKAQLKEQKKNLLHTLYELQNPKKIKDYAEKKLGMKSLSRHALKRINLHE